MAQAGPKAVSCISRRSGIDGPNPKSPDFLKDDWATQPAFSPDGRTLYFSSSRGKEDIRHYSLWRSLKTEDGWSEPESVIDMGGGPMMEYHPTVACNGSVYFLLWDFPRQIGDLYVSEQVDGCHAEPVLLASPVSGPYNDTRPTVDPQGRYLLFGSNRPGGYGGTDIYITFKKADGSWTTPRNLGPTVNTPANDDMPNISPDGKYWFFARDGDIYWRQVPDIVGKRIVLFQSQPEGHNLESQLIKAHPLPMGSVHLTGGPLKQAQDLMSQTLLELEPDRMLAGYRLRAGLEPKAEGYGGWDQVDARRLTGHLAGHYLSAISLMYTVTGNEEFRQRAQTILDEFETIQNAQGNGYLGALLGYRPDPQGGDSTELVDARELLELVADDVIVASGDYWEYLNGVWAPWYVYHKTCAGLRDAYRLLGLEKALEIEVKFAQWTVTVVEPLSESKVQRMLETEFGGMGEIMVDLYTDTGDLYWLHASRYWEQDAFIDPLKRHEDVLGGKHGNTQMPKLIASLDRYACTGDAGDLSAAAFFWDTVVHHHTFATGGHGHGEFFGPADRFSEYVDGRTCETCNVYNMLKLTRRLFEFAPDGRYADFQERALFNHILASIDPNNGATCYMVPVGMGVRQEYTRSMLDGSFTCCVCSSLESHALHTQGIYYEDGDTLWVNLYTPSTVQWQAAGLALVVETDFPMGETATLRVTQGSPRPMTLSLRRPGWTGEGFTVKVNGEVVPLSPAHWMKQERRGPGWYRDPQRILGDPVSDYIELERVWRAGDCIEVLLPKSLRLESTPDDPDRAAVLWGPLVLAGDVTDLATPYPVLKVAGQPVTEWLKPVGDQPGAFRTNDVNVTFRPFYRTHRRTYGIYWPLATAN